MCSKDPELRSYIPENEPKPEDVFGKDVTCAIVSSSPDLRSYSYAKFIDSHDVVLRFNNHDSYLNLSKEYYGGKTTHMMMHCAIFYPNPKEPVYRRFDYFENRKEFVLMNHASMYWDMKKHNGTLSEEYWHSTLIPHYKEFYQHRKHALNRTFVLNHEFLWQAYVAYEGAAARKVFC